MCEQLASSIFVNNCMKDGDIKRQKKNRQGKFAGREKQRKVKRGLESKGEREGVKFRDQN